MSLETQAHPSLAARIFLTAGEHTERGERRLRTLWRLLLFAILLVIFTVVLTIPLLFTNLTGFTGILVSQLVTALAATAAVLVARRFIDRRSILSLGFVMSRRALADLIFGILITGVLMGLIYLAQSALRWTLYTGTAAQALNAGEILREVVVPTLYLFVLVGWTEEILFRGYIFKNITDGSNLWWGLGLSSALFAVAHGLNPGISPIAIAGLFLAGLFMAYGAVRTGQLWLPIGLHIGWNFFEGPVFGFPVSGLNIPRIIQQVENGPDLWTGGLFGPEAGLVVIPALALGAGMIYLYTLGRKTSPSI